MATKHIGIRLPEKTLDELGKLAQVKMQTPNKLAKTAIIEWLDYQKIAHSDMITIPRENFAILLSLLDPAKQEEYIENIAEKVLRMYEYDAHKLAKFAQLENFIHTMVHFIGKQGFRWFDHLDYQIHEEPFFFTGRHQMGQIWSTMFLQIFMHIIDRSGATFEICHDKIICNEYMVYLELRKISFKIQSVEEAKE